MELIWTTMHPATPTGDGRSRNGRLQSKARALATWLSLGICALWFGGCASLQPTAERRAESAGKPWAGKDAAPSYPLAETAAGLLNMVK